MKKYIGVLNSNAVNKYNFCFAISALEDVVWKKCLSGLPTNIGHDRLRPIGWTIPFGLHIEPGVVRTVGTTLLIETDEDAQEVNEARQSVLIAHVREESEEYMPGFAPYIESYYSGEQQFLGESVFTCHDTNIIERIFPELRILAEKDKNGLIELQDLLEKFKYKGQGVFECKNKPLLVFAHSYFRRSLSHHNNFHFVFLDQLVQLHSNKNVKVKIAIDYDIVGYAPSRFEAQELEYWWGPTYSDDISTISPGHTMHKSSDFERTYSGISATEFFWKINDNLHEFELEELKEEPAPEIVDNYGCRYVHSIYDDTAKEFIHFDGAIRMYDGEQYLERISKKMTECGRQSKYTKLFRVDGHLELKDWKSLTTNYLQGNLLIYEYFGLTKPTQNENPQPRPLTVKEKYVPFSIDEGDGVRVMVSYFAKNELTENRVVSICDKLTIGERTYNFLEYDVIEVKKALNRMGKEVTLPADTMYGYAKDMYWNIPTIFHGSNLPENDVNDTYIAIQTIVNALVAKGVNKVISFTLAWNMEDKEVRVSILGHCVDLGKWFEKIKSIPANREGLIEWINSVSEYLDGLGINGNDKPELAEVVKFDGVFYMKRRAIEDVYDVSFSADENGIKYSIRIPENEQDLWNAVSAGEITPVMSCIAKKLICSKDGNDYRASPYSAILDDDVQLIESDFQLFGAYWSDKPERVVYA